MKQAKIIFITGCANGIGKYLAEALYAQGNQLILTDVMEEKLLELYKHWDAERILLLKLDVSKPEDWERAMEKTLEKWDHLDVIINNAGVIVPGYIHQTDLKNVDFHIDINLKGVIYGTRFASRQMVKQGFGQIINIASLAGIAPTVGLDLYTASKFGVRGFSLAIAPVLRKHNVFVSVVCPDLVNTHMLTLQLDYEEAALTFSGNRVLSTEEIGNVIIRKGVEKKQLEIMHPYSRGLLAKLSSFFPKLSFSPVMSNLLKKGAKKQALLKQKS